MRRPAVALAFSLALVALAAGAWFLLRERPAPSPDPTARRGDPRNAAPNGASSGAGAPRVEDPARTNEVEPARGGVDDRHGAFAGRVETLDGAPIEGAELELHGDDFEHALVRTASGADGAFRFDGLVPMGAAGVVARKDGFVSGFVREELDAVRAGLVTTLPTLRLEAAAIVRGRTLDAERRPLAGVEVTILHFNDPPVLSDEEGKFTLRRVPPRSTQIGARKEGWISRRMTTLPIVPRPGDGNPEVEFLFVRAGRLHGTIRTRAGAPVPDCGMQARVEQPFRRASGQSLQRSADDGTYAITDLPAGGSGFARPVSPWLVEVEERPIAIDGDPVDFVVEPWPILRFDVVDAASGAHVTPEMIELRVVDPDVEPAPDPGTDPARARFDAATREATWRPGTKGDGGESFRTTAAGLVEVPFGRELRRRAAQRGTTGAPTACAALISAPGYRVAVAEFTVAAPDALPTLRVEMAPGLAVVGRVLDDDGAPLAGAGVSLLAELEDDARGWGAWHGVLVPDDHALVACGVSDPAGRFQLDVERVPDRSVRVRARAPGRAVGESEPFVVAPQGRTTADVRLPRGGALEGRVTLAGAPAVNRHVVAFRADGVAAAERSDADGRYRFAALPAGRYVVRLGSNDAVMEHALGASFAGAARRAPPERCDVEIVEGATARFDLDVDAPPGQGIAGVVRTAPGAAEWMSVGAARIDAAGGRSFDGVAPQVLLDRDGRFLLNDLAPGAWRVEVRDAAREGSSVHADVVVSPGRWTHVELEFVRRRLRGCVFDRRTARPIEVRAALAPVDAPAPERPPDPAARQFATGWDGGFAIDDLLATEYVARFAPYAPSGRARELRIDLRDHDVLDLRVELDARSSLTIDLPELLRAGGELQSIALESAAGTIVPPSRDDGRRRVYDDVDPGPCMLLLGLLGSDGVLWTERLEIDVLPCTDFYANPFVTQFLATREKR